MYENDYQAAEKIYIDIFKYAKSKSEFNENTEKLLNQVQAAFNKLYPCSLKLLPSHKIQKYNKHLKHLILNSIKQSSNNISHIEFNDWETKLGLKPNQKDLLYKTAMTFQLTSGCSNYCKRCNEWALPKVRKHFSYDAVLTIIKHMVLQNNNEISLYGASDPLDWTHGKKNICDIIKPKIMT